MNVSEPDRFEWEQFTREANAHLLQTAAWGELKSAFGWQARRILLRQGELTLGAQILFKRLLPGVSTAYLPRGPVCNQGSIWEMANEPQQAQFVQTFWQAVDRLCRRQGAVFLKIEPDEWQAGATNAAPPGFQASTHSIQPPRTLVVSLQGSEEEILARMKQKTRYNIKLAGRRGVSIEAGSDLAGFSALMQITGQRDGFGVHSQAYYESAYRLFQPVGQAELLLAKYQGQALAGLMVFACGGRSWYLYGASSNEYREVMSTYLLQWEAMRWAKASGCYEYDLWGVPDADLEALEAGFEQRADGLWGVYRFKRGFGGELRRSAGPWDRVYQPLLYQLYRWRMRRAGI